MVWLCSAVTLWWFDYVTLTVWWCDYVTLWLYDGVTLWLGDRVRLHQLGFLCDCINFNWVLELHKNCVLPSAAENSWSLLFSSLLQIESLDKVKCGMSSVSSFVTHLDPYTHRSICDSVLLLSQFASAIYDIGSLNSLNVTREDKSGVLYNVHCVIVSWW